MVFFSTCHDTIRTLPALQHDAARPEDVDTNGEDHAGRRRALCLHVAAVGAAGEGGGAGEAAGPVERIVRG